MFIFAPSISSLTPLVGPAISFGIGIYPAYRYSGKEPHKLLASVLLQVGINIGSNLLKSYDYISDFGKTVIDYTTGSFIFCTSYHSYGDLITNSGALKDFLKANPMIANVDPHDVAKAFSFGMASLANIHGAEEVSKIILNHTDTSHTYELDHPLAGAWLGARYSIAMGIKYHICPHLPEDATNFEKFSNIHYYFLGGGAQGIIANSLDQVTKPNNFTLGDFTKDSITSFYNDGVNHALYSTVAEMAFSDPRYKHIIEAYPATSYFPISTTIEEFGVVFGEFCTPTLTNNTLDLPNNILDLANYSMHLVEEALSSNATQADEL